MKGNWNSSGAIALAVMLALLVPATLAEEGEKTEFEGGVEVLWRNVSVDGSTHKYNEDFDGLDSGGRLSNLSLNWNDISANAVDYARVDLFGLGGDPYEMSRFRIGRQDAYDLTFSYRKQDYLYNLFDETFDLDGHTWDTERSFTDINLTLHPSKNLNVFLEFHEVDRTGNSVFMKDIERDLFRLPTPVDNTRKNYVVGVDFDAGPVDIVLRQIFRRYSNEFDNSTSGNAGLNGQDSAVLDSYNWQQRDRGDADITQLNVHAPLGSRVDLTVGVWGTFLGEEELTSRVDVNADGTNFGGGVFEIIDGFSDTVTEMDTTYFDVDLAWAIVDPLTLILRYDDLDRQIDSTGSQALSGRTCLTSGTPCATDAECDAIVAGDTCEDPSTINTSLEWQINTSTALLEWAPTRNLVLRGGYKTIDRSLARNGFGHPLRDGDFESDGDETIVAGISWEATDWLKLDADYEDGNVDQVFTSVSPYETERNRIRLTFTPEEGIRIGVNYLDYENRNFATAYPSALDGETTSIDYYQRVSDHWNFSFRYGRQDVLINAAILFDTFAFGGTEDGNSIYDNDNDQFSTQLNWMNGPYSVFFRFWATQSDGNNIFQGNLSGVINDQVIAQDYTDGEIGMRYTMRSGLMVGGSFRAFDYDDANNLLDYDGQIFTMTAGFRF